jgi:hypothetical protein
MDDERLPPSRALPCLPRAGAIVGSAGRVGRKSSRFRQLLSLSISLMPSLASHASFRGDLQAAEESTGL